MTRQLNLRHTHARVMVGNQPRNPQLIGMRGGLDVELAAQDVATGYIADFNHACRRQIPESHRRSWRTKARVFADD
jgi:hypothetical protein